MESPVCPGRRCCVYHLVPLKQKAIVGGSAVSQPIKANLPLMKATQSSSPVGGGDRLRHPPSSARDHARDSFQPTWALLTFVSPEVLSPWDATVWRSTPCCRSFWDEQASTVLQLPALGKWSRICRPLGHPWPLAARWPRQPPQC